MPAMIARRNVARSSEELGSSITRLSTGLRINTAGDDPSGLIASEGFRAQILSIDSATRNNQDAINYSKTAEAALAEVNRLLSDARALAITAGNTATLSASQIQANQDQLNSIANSITRIATNTQFGVRRLLDGSSGVQAQVSAGSRVQGISMVGTYRGSAITQSGLITVNSVTPGARALFTSSVLTGGVILNAGSFSVNGNTFSFPAGTTGGAVAAAINGVTAQTGVTANFNTATNALTLVSVNYGSNAMVNFTDANGVISASGTNVSAQGTNAVASVNIGGLGNALFTGGRNGIDGLSLFDSDGNMIKLTEAGNVTAGYPATVGQVSAGIANFQIGANANQTAQLALPNLAASQLGSDVFGGISMANLDLSSGAAAAQALQVIDRAIEQVSSSRGRIGQFTKYVLESNNRSLSAARENMAATESAIRDVDMAAEMTEFTKYQVLQQAGISILGQANGLSQNILPLIRG
jgi:flagellin